MNRSIRRGIAILMAALTIFFAGQPAVTAYAATTAKTTTAVYMRKGATTSSKSILVVPSGKEVTVLDTSNTKWYKVKYNNKTGYIYTKYLKNTVTTETLKTAVNLRKSMSTANSKNIIRVLPKGAKVTILSKEKNNWYKVSWNNYKGYIKGGYFMTSSSAKPAETIKEKRVAKTAVNFRKSNSTSSKILGVIQKGKTVYELQLVSGGWSKVEYNGKVGYVMRKYLD